MQNFLRMMSNNFNNGKLLATHVMSDFNNLTYFFYSIEENSKLKATKNGNTVLAFSLSEIKGKMNLYISLPKNIMCEHYKDGIKTCEILSSDGTHLSYHGNSNKRKQKGEIHINHHEQRVHKERENLLEAPLCTSNDISFYPLPICRIELNNTINALKDKNITNFFELELNGIFLNTIDVFLAKKGFMKNILSEPDYFPENLPSYFAYTSLEGIYKGNIITGRRGRYPQILVLQSKNFEVILICMQEAQNQLYATSTLKYAQSINYLEELFQRNIVELKEGFLISEKRNTNVDELVVINKKV